MNLKSLFPIVEILVLSLSVCLLHWSVLHFLLPNQESQLHFQPGIIYAFFTGCATAITLISIIVRHFNVHNVGQAFMLTTFLEMFACFAVFYTKLNPSKEGASIGRTNFIIVFLLFLAIETIVTVRLLNKKQ